jgi:hypothetical protein
VFDPGIGGRVAMPNDGVDASGWRVRSSHVMIPGGGGGGLLEKEPTALTAEELSMLYMNYATFLAIISHLTPSLLILASLISPVAFCCQ